MLNFFCPDSQMPYGGIKVIYHCVDVLNDEGLDASVVHRQPDFRCEWFTKSTRVIAAGDIRWTHADIAVLPEISGSELPDIPEQLKRVIFNQNAYYTFRGYSLEAGDRRSLYRHPDTQ